MNAGVRQPSDDYSAMVNTPSSDKPSFIVEKWLDGRWRRISAHSSEAEAANVARELERQALNTRVRLISQGSQSSKNEPEDAVNKTNVDILRVLVVEDEPINQKVVVAFLNQIPCRCDCVGNGAEAVAAVMRSPYDVVLMDIQMPVMDGVRATQEIRALGGEIGNVPIIAVTANVDQRDRQEYFAAGMNGYIAKPIDRKLLLDTVRQFTSQTTSSS